MSQRSYRNCKVTLDVERDNDTRDMHRIVAQWDLDGRTTGPVVSDIRLEDVQAKLSPVRQRLAEMRRRPEEAELERQDLGGDLFKAMMPSVPIQTEVLRYLRGVLFREGKRTGDGVRISVQCLTDALEATPWELASVPFLDAGRFAPIVLEDGVSVVRLGRPDDDPPPVGPLGSLRVFFVDAGRCCGAGSPAGSSGRVRTIRSTGPTSSTSPVMVSGARRVVTRACCSAPGEAGRPGSGRKTLPRRS